MTLANAHWEDLADMLRDELQEYGEFLVLLDEQQHAILSQDADLLRDLDQDIQRQIQNTQDMRERRTDMVVTFAELAGFPKDASLRQILPCFPQSAQPLMLALINEINSLIEKTRRALRQNHMLLARASEVTEKLIAALAPAPTTKTYGKTGNISFKSGRVGSCIRTSA